MLNNSSNLVILLTLFSFIFFILTHLSSFLFSLKNKENPSGEMVQWLKVFVALPEYAGLIPSTPMILTTVCNSSFRANNAM